MAGQLCPGDLEASSLYNALLFWVCNIWQTIMGLPYSPQRRHQAVCLLSAGAGADGAAARQRRSRAPRL